MLVERVELRVEHVLYRHHPEVHRGGVDELGAREQLVVDRQPGGLEDEVDQDVAVPDLQQPGLRRVLGAHAGADERLLRAAGVLRLDDHVEVVRGGRAAARPAREAPADQERDLGGVERGDGALEGLLDEAEWQIELGHGSCSALPERRYG